MGGGSAAVSNSMFTFWVSTPHRALLRSPDSAFRNELCQHKELLNDIVTIASRKTRKVL